MTDTKQITATATVLDEKHLELDAPLAMKPEKSFRITIPQQAKIPPTPETSFLQTLLDNPLVVKDFIPFVRKGIYDRSELC